jgi:hypothetical protein
VTTDDSWDRTCSVGAGVTGGASPSSTAKGLEAVPQLGQTLDDPAERVESLPGPGNVSAANTIPAVIARQVRHVEGAPSGLWC